MPIIYVHGVNTRSSEHSEPVKEYLRRIVAPAISKDPENVSIQAADWFQFCDPPKWDGIARPRTTLLGHGGQSKVVRNEAVELIIAQAAKRVASSADPFTSGQEKTTTVVRLEKLDDGELADLVVLTLATEATAPIEAARIGVAADKAVRDKVIRARIKAAAGLDGQLKILADAVEEKLVEELELEAHGSLEISSAA